MTPRAPDVHSRIGSSRPRRTPAALSAVSLLLSWASIAAGAHGQPPHCSLRHDGVQVIAEFSSQDARRGHQLTFDLVVSGGPPERRSSALTIARGGRLVLQLESNLAGTAPLRVHLTAGLGFHGFREEDLTSSDGQTFEGTVDGRALVPFRPDAGLRTLAFADGKPAPRVKEKAFVRKGLRRLAREALASPCLDDPTGGASAEARGLIDSCDFCQAKCIGKFFFRCGAEAVASGAGCGLGPVACAALFGASGYDCSDGTRDCDDACLASSDCCAVPCAGGHGDACGRSCSEDAVCCGGQSCCSSGAQCCGTVCCDTVNNDMHCANPSTGLCCFNDHMGDECGSQYCCPTDKPVCRDPGRLVCCAPDSGDVCGDDCCPASAPMCVHPLGVCCAPENVCGQGCCVPPNVCQAGGSCCTPDRVCGSNCCEGEETCLDPSRSLCCGGIASKVCGNNCCGPEETCLGDSCCPLAQVCGGTCCAPGAVCSDPSTHTCSACDPGTVPCAPGGGGPALCCAPGATCCAGPPPQCCGASQCCAGTPYTCHDSSDPACTPR
jgi:hypothetical protein